MKIQKQRLESEFDGLSLEAEVFIPENVRGIVQISHGMAEYKERYEGFMEYLADYGYLVVIHDHRGHGGSVKNQEELGYFYTEDPNAIVEDLYQITREIKRVYPKVPVYLFSHSMGTLVARNYMKTHDHEIDKLILCGPPTKNPAVDMALFLTRCSKAIKGGTYRNKRIHAMAFHGYDKKGEGENSWLTTDEDVVALYNHDPFCGYTFTNNGFWNLFQLMKSAFQEEGWEKNNLDLPVFVIAGEEDPVIQSKEKFEHLLSFLSDLGYTNVKSKLYPGMRHELLNEEKKEDVFEDILDFLES